MTEQELGYAQCQSQPAADPSQRAPAFMSEMDVCRAQSVPPTAKVTGGVGAGELNEDGNCAYPSGVVCHFHAGKEFLADSTSRQEEGVGELHCIVPTEETNRPTVFGAHVRCAASSASTSSEADAGPGAACPSELLEVFARCSEWRCCDEGTLTNPLDALPPDLRSVTPDFRICSEKVLEVDCRLLAAMKGHPAYAPASGGTVERVFTPNAP